MRKLCSALLTIALGTPGALSALDAREDIAEANRLYDAGKFSQAIEKYDYWLGRGALSAEDEAILRYNAANAWLKRKNYPKAIEEYRRSLPGLKGEARSQALNNLGNALAAQGQGERALQSYLDALQNNPADDTPRRNIERLYGAPPPPQRQKENDSRQSTADKEKKKPPPSNNADNFGGKNSGEPQEDKDSGQQSEQPADDQSGAPDQSEKTGETGDKAGANNGKAEKQSGAADREAELSEQNKDWARRMIEEAGQKKISRRMTPKQKPDRNAKPW